MSYNLCEDLKESSRGQDPMLEKQPWWEGKCPRKSPGNRRLRGLGLGSTQAPLGLGTSHCHWTPKHPHRTPPTCLLLQADRGNMPVIPLLTQQGTKLACRTRDLPWWMTLAAPVQAMNIREQIGYPDYILEENNRHLDEEYSDVRTLGNSAWPHPPP